MTAATITLNAGTGGPLVLTDTLTTVDGAAAPASAQAQVAKMAWGDANVANMVSAATPMPMSAAFLPLPTGAATEVTLALLAGAVKAEDSPAVSGDLGVAILARRTDADGSLSGADGDYENLQLNAVGRLKVSAQPSLAPLVVGNITANAQTVFIDVARQSNLMAHMVATSLVGHNSTFEGSIDSTNGTNGAWFALQAVRSNANTIELVTGVLAATPTYGWELSVNGLAWARVRATAHTSGTANWKFQPAPYATEPIPASQVSATQSVSGTVTANQGTMVALPAGTSTIGDVGLQVRANATGAAAQHHIVSTATTNVLQIKATAGRVVGWCLSNTTASWRYVKLHNVASATAGAAVQQTIGIPPNGQSSFDLTVGIAFTTAISRSIVTGAADADATATAASDVVGDIFFA